MIGLDLVKKNIVRISNDEHIVRVPLRFDEMALLQMNEKEKRLDCVVLKNNKLREEYTLSPLENSTEAFFKMVKKFVEKIAVSSRENHVKIMHRLKNKSIK